MDTMEELRHAFDQAITDASNQEINDLRSEMEMIKEQTKKEINEEVSRNVMRWYEQEAEEMRLSYAQKQSKIKEAYNQMLQQERTVLVEQLFEQVRQNVQAFHNSKEYETSIQNKLAVYQNQDLGDFVLMMGEKDQKLLEKLCAGLKENCTSEIDPAIQMGGFRILLKEKGRMIDESYDQAFAQAKVDFLEASGLMTE